MEKKRVKERNVNARDKLGFTRLHHAVAALDVALAERLFEAGADVNVYSKSGILPVHCVFLGDKLDRKSGKKMKTENGRKVPDSEDGDDEEEDEISEDEETAAEEEEVAASSADEGHAAENTEVSPTQSQTPVNIEPGPPSSQATCAQSAETEGETSKDGEEGEDGDEDTEDEYKEMGKEGKEEPKHREVMEILLKHGCDLDATTRCGARITDYEGFWASRIHRWITKQPILLPNFTDMVNDYGGMYRTTRDMMHHYLRAGSRDELAVHSVAVLSVLNGSRKDHFEVAYYTNPHVVNAIDMGFLFDEEFWDCRKKLHECISYFIGFIYRVCGDGMPWQTNEKSLLAEDPEKKHLYWLHKKNKRTVLMLKFCCCVTIRYSLGAAAGGRSILPAIDKLPLPKSLRKMLNSDLKTKSFKTK